MEYRFCLEAGCAQPLFQQPLTAARDKKGEEPNMSVEAQKAKQIIIDEIKDKLDGAQSSVIIE